MRCEKCGGPTSQYYYKKTQKMRWQCDYCNRKRDDVSVYVSEHFVPSPTTISTDSVQGTKERIEAYARRADRGEVLFSEDDPSTFEQTGQVPILRGQRGSGASSIREFDESSICDGFN